MNDNVQGLIIGISLAVAFLFNEWIIKRKRNEELYKLREEKKWWDSMIQQAKDDVKAKQ